MCCNLCSEKWEKTGKEVYIQRGNSKFNDLEVAGAFVSPWFFVATFGCVFMTFSS